MPTVPTSLPGDWRRSLRCLSVLFAVLTAVGQAAEPNPEPLEFFERQVRPLLATHCYRCHSGEGQKLQAGLRVDSRAALLRGGDSGAAIVPGDADASLLIEAVRYESFEMPPQGKLDERQIDVLRRWIAMGAPWPDEPPPTAEPAAAEFDLHDRRHTHWAWQPIQNPTPPQVADADWPASPIDRFVLARLEQAQLTPAPPVDRRGLIRRLYFDLIGLPPTPQQVQRFLNDPSESAVQRVVDQLLQSPHFGERWGRHWLDLVRYAESRGHEHDNDAPNAYQYRDYVIRGLNADVPYDQWVREHLAGDLLDPPRLHPSERFNESILGTGFWFLGEWVHSPVDIRKEEADRLDNMIDVMSKTFLGLTVACARCHDHKFDAISTQDYYSLTGFLQSCDYRQVRFETMPSDRRIAQRIDQCDARHRNRVRSAILEAVRPDLSQLPRVLAAAAELAAAAPTASGSAVATSAQRRRLDAGMLRQWRDVLQPLIRDGQLLRLPWQPSGSGEAVPLSGEHADVRIMVDYASITPDQYMQDGFAFGSAPLRRGELRLASAAEVVQQAAAAFDPIWNGIVSLSEPATNQRNALASIPRSGRTLRTPTFELQHPRIACLVRGSGHVVACVDSHRLVYGPLHKETIQQIPPVENRAPQWLQIDLGRYVGHRLHLEFTPDAAGTLQVMQIVSGKPEPLAEAIHAGRSSPSERSAEATMDALAGQIGHALDGWSKRGWEADSVASERAACLDWVVRHLACFCNPSAPAMAKVRESIAAWHDERRQLQQQIPLRSQTAMAMLDGTGEDGRVLIRGSVDNPGPVVPRHFLEAVDGRQPLKISVGSGRLQLAQRINDPANPLTARVIVNRLWHHLLGRGIVATVDDFGALGQPPSHPQLLDHLARWFLDHDQSVKQTIRYIVLSETYQLSSLASSESRQRDPANQLWQHVPPRRLEGEAVRDAILAVSGNLDRAICGRSVPVHLTAFMDGRGRPSVSGPLDGASRRSLYTAVRRNFLSPFQLAFDAPSPFSTMGRRNTSNVPAQALILMNDPLVVAQARAWGNAALAAVPEDAPQRIIWMYETAFARPPRDEELQLAIKFVHAQAAQRRTHSDAPAIWADLAHTLMNLKEFIYLR